MSQEIDQVITLLQEMNKKLNPKSRLEELTEEIKKTQGLEHLFVDDPQKYYFCSAAIMSTKFSHLQKCVILTSKFKILEEYIDLYLTEHPETINYVNCSGWTALMIAVKNLNLKSSERTVEILLNHGANVDLQTKQDYSTALMIAVKSSRTDSSEEIVELLLNHGANVNLQDEFGKTALIYAARDSNSVSTERTVEILLEHGADVNIQDSNGWTALMYSIKYLNHTSTEKVVEILFNHGAKINLRNEEDHSVLKTAVNYCNSPDRKRILKLIIEKMSNCDIQINGTKLIKYLWDKKIPKDIIELTIQKGANKYDIIDNDIIDNDTYDFLQL